MENTVYIGQSISSIADPLQPTSIQQLYELIADINSPYRERIEQLRITRSVDAKRYAELKRSLPYMVCAKFQPLVRKSENFAYTQCFILDVDHIAEKGLHVSLLKEKIQNDERVGMCFVSPSKDGLKILFNLKERCYDKGQYSVAYKKFAQQFANQYNLEQVIDTRTSDVTRACFLSFDTDAYFNPSPIAVDMDAYVNREQTYLLLDEKRELEKQERDLPKEEKISVKDPDNDAITKIKEILALRVPKIAKPPIFVPEQLNLIVEYLKQRLEACDICVDEIIDIQYGKKFRVTLQDKHAECNVFYGKHGFKVVISPRTGTDRQLNDLLSNLLTMFIHERLYGTQEEAPI